MRITIYFSATEFVFVDNVDRFSYNGITKNLVYTIDYVEYKVPNVVGITAEK